MLPNFKATTSHLSDPNFFFPVERNHPVVQDLVDFDFVDDPTRWTQFKPGAVADNALIASTQLHTTNYPEDQTLALIEPHLNFLRVSIYGSVIAEGSVWGDAPDTIHEWQRRLLKQINKGSTIPSTPLPDRAKIKMTHTKGFLRRTSQQLITTMKEVVKKHGSDTKEEDFCLAAWKLLTPHYDNDLFECVGVVAAWSYVALLFIEMDVTLGSEFRMDLARAMEIPEPKEEGAVGKTYACEFCGPAMEKPCHHILTIKAIGLDRYGHVCVGCGIPVTNKVLCHKCATKLDVKSQLQLFTIIGNRTVVNPELLRHIREDLAELNRRQFADAIGVNYQRMVLLEGPKSESKVSDGEVKAIKAALRDKGVDLTPFI